MSILVGVIIAMVLGLLAGIVIGYVRSRRTGRPDARSRLPREPR